MIETYRGEALAWEADDLGHVNMRFYIERSEQARIQFFSHLGLPDIYKARALSTLISTQYHIQYIREVTPGYGMWVETHIVEMGETHMGLEHRIFKSPDILAATVVETVSHISARTRKAFAWPKRVVAQANAHRQALSEDASARNLDMTIHAVQPKLDAALALGMAPIGRGAFAPRDCDVFGIVRPYMLFGKVSDSVQHLKAAWPDVNFQTDHPISGALLEARCTLRKSVQAGQSYVICSGLIEANEYVRKICHWMFDPQSGEPLMSCIGVGCLFNLESRKLVKASPKWVERLQDNIVHGCCPNSCQNTEFT